MPAMTTDPLARECLRCYLTRMLNSRGCDGTKTWATRWRDHRMPQAEGLLGQLADRGGCCCDCEMIFNAWADPDESIDPATRATCHGTDDTDPLVPCTGWSLTPQTQVMPPGDYESDEAYW